MHYAYYYVYRVCIRVTLLLVSYSVLESVTLCVLVYGPVLLNFCLNYLAFRAFSRYFMSLLYVHTVCTCHSHNQYCRRILF